VQAAPGSGERDRVRRDASSLERAARDTGKGEVVDW